MPDSDDSVFFHFSSKMFIFVSWPVAKIINYSIIIHFISQDSLSVSKWFQMEKLSTIKLYNLSRFTTFILVIFLYNFFWTIWIWISKYNNFKQHFKILNDFKWKNCQQQSCITYQDLQLLFWSFLHITFFEQFEFECENMTTSKPNFQILNDFN